jgi:hypothetical protein
MVVGAAAVALVLAVALAVVLGHRSSDDREATTAQSAVSAAPRAEAAEPAVPVLPPFELTRWGSGLPRAGQWRDGFVLVDFDGDGRLDLVHGPARKSPERVPQIFSGDGAGNFKIDTRYRFPKLPLDYGDVAVADFDGDGALDLAVASHLIGIAVLVRRGDAFEPYATDIGLLGATNDTRPGDKPAKGAKDGKPAAGATASGSFSSRAIEATDWNGDGRVDLIAESDGPRPFEALKGGRSRRNIAVLLGKPGGFTPIFPVNNVPGYGDSLAIGNVDLMPGLEIVAASNVVGSKYVVYRVSEMGLVLTELPAMPAGRTVRVVALVPGREVMSVLLGGMASGEQGLEGTLDLVRGGSALNTTRLYKGEPLRAVSAIGVGDLDGDGSTDVVAGEEDGTLRVFLARGNGFGAAGTVPAAPQLAGCAVYAIQLANLDGNAGDEVVASYAGDDGACASSGAIEVFRHP